MISLFILLLSLGFPTVIVNQPPNADDELTKAEEQLIEWYDSLGYPDLSQLPTVSVATGWWSQSGNDPPTNQFVIAFLKQEEGDDFSVFGLDLVERRFTLTPAGTAPHKAIFFEYLNLKEVAADQIEQVNNIDPEDHWRRFGKQVSEPMEMLVLARACAANDLNQQAHDLLERAAALPDPRRGRGDADGLLDQLKRDHAHTMMWRAVVNFGNKDVKRPELLKQFEFVVKHFPDSEHHDRATKTIEMLRQMIAEDEEHAKTAKAVDKLKGDELVAELIFRLRDQNGQQWSQPGSCNIFLDERGEESPADRLVALGFDAVPLLIKAIDDTRFTRSVGYHRNFCFSHHVLRVGDCAQTILSKIAGKSFYVRKHTNGAMAKDGKTKTTKDLALEWWKEIQNKGEKQVLIEATQKGDSGTMQQARKLVNKYPEEAVAAIGVGILNANGWVREGLIRLLAQIGDEDAIEIIRTQMLEAPELDSRVTAAHALLDSGESTIAIKTMLDEWKRPRDGKPEFEEQDAIARLAQFLLKSGSLQGIKSVSEVFHDLSVNTKYEIIESLDEMALVSNESRAAIERFLVDRLLDTDERAGMSGSMNGQSFSDPRICDIAGHILSVLWPQKYQCRMDGTERERDQNRFAANNHWRVANNYEPIDVPRPFEIAIVPEEKTEPLIALIRASKTLDEGLDAFSELENLGPGAIRAAEKLQRLLGNSHPFAGKAEKLLISLPNTITVIHFHPKSAKVEDAWSQKITSLKDDALTSDKIIELCIEFAKIRPVAGISLKAVRDGEGNGIELEVNFIDRQEPRGGSQRMWKNRRSVILGTKSILNSQGSSSLKHATNTDAYDKLKTCLDQALGEPNTYMKASVSLIINE